MQEERRGAASATIHFTQAQEGGNGQEQEGYLHEQHCWFVTLQLRFISSSLIRPCA
jgi:hypothetical protein